MSTDFFNTVQSQSHCNLNVGLNQNFDQVHWCENVTSIPTAVRGLRGYRSFLFSDLATRDVLGLPSFPEGNGFELYLLATGPYGMQRANGALTATREFELSAARRAGELGTLSNYNELASLLPQTTRVFYFQQLEMPTGYREGLYGLWPDCPVVVLKVQISSSHKTPTNRANLNTVTLVVATVPPRVSKLCLMGHLKALIAHHCTCLAGASTNRACAHTVAVAKGLFCPGLFKSAKKKSSRLTDIHRLEPLVIQILFHALCVRHPSSSILVVFNFGHLPFWSSWVGGA